VESIANLTARKEQIGLNRDGSLTGMGPSRDISSGMPPLLLLQDISVTFGVTPLLSGAELAVAAGDRVCLVGRNGSGKSALLRIAAGLVQPDAGDRFAQRGRL
jgi:ABC-type molybdenum transport system ATPase subunit/photorepair protein PhrA